MKRFLTMMLLGAAALPALPALAQEAPPPATPAGNQADIEQLNAQLKATQEQLKSMQEQLKSMQEQRATAAKAGGTIAGPEAPTPPTPPTPPAAPTPPSPPTPPAAPAPLAKDGNVHVGSVMLTNSDYVVRKQEVVDGDVRVVKGDLQVDGTVNGDASTVSGDLQINGHVMGNAVAVHGDISLGPNAVVEGDVKAVGGDVERSQGATVHGAIRNDAGGPSGVGGGDGRVESSMFNGPFNLPIAITAMLLGMAMLVAWPRRVDTVGKAFVNRPGHSFVIGLASAPVAILAIVVSAISIVGPILVIFGYVGAFFMGLAAMALMLGRRIVLGRPYKSRFFPLVVGLGVWLLAMMVSHVATPLFVLMTIGTSLAYVMAIGAALSTGFGTSPFWLRDRLAHRTVGPSYMDPTQTYAGADAYGDVI